MLDQIPKPTRERTKEEVTRVCVYVTKDYLQDFRNLKNEVRKFSGQKLTLAFVFRQGGSNFMKALRKQMSLAKKGELHAKKRKA
jgi:hypothetical protein